MNINNNPLYRTETIENDKLEKLTICGKVRGHGICRDFEGLYFENCE